MHVVDETDIDPEETLEWIESLDSVLEREGPERAHFLLERLIDKAARETGRDPVDLRRLNFVQPDQFPYETPVAVAYDTGDYGATMDKVIEISDRAGFEARRAESAPISRSSMSPAESASGLSNASSRCS